MSNAKGGSRELVEMERETYTDRHRERQRDRQTDRGAC